ncbi:MAG: hypothetical protein PHN42_01405 [Bacilli bacterium]|nr:hypothetical protein [Bacilli bacterium]
MNEKIKLDIINNFIFDENEQKGFGNNEAVIARIIKFLSNIKNIEFKQNFINLLNYNENFKIFETNSSSSNYMANFKALSIKTSDDDYVIGHELGHAVLNLIDDTNVPNDFEQIVNNAKNNALNENNLELTINNIKHSNARLRILLEYICNEKNKMEDKNPLSDIISSMWQATAFPTVDGNILKLPAVHNPEYYFDKKKLLNNVKELDYKKIYDEQFANFFILYINNRLDTLDILRKIFGNDWFNLMNNKVNELLNNLIMSKKEIKTTNIK